MCCPQLQSLGQKAQEEGGGRPALDIVLDIYTSVWELKSNGSACPMGKCAAGKVASFSPNLLLVIFENEGADSTGQKQAQGGWMLGKFLLHTSDKVALFRLKHPLLSQPLALLS